MAHDRGGTTVSNRVDHERPKPSRHPTSSSPTATPLVDRQTRAGTALNPATFLTNQMVGRLAVEGRPHLFAPLHPDRTSNQTLQRLLGPPTAQRQPTGQSSSPWAKSQQAIQSARAAKNDAQADQLTKEAIAAVAATATFPATIAKTVPTAGDIRLDPKMPATAHAQTRPKEIPTDPANYWSWLFFSPSLIDGGEVQIQMIITHELVHVGQFQRLWDQYQNDKSAKKPGWNDFLKPYQERKRVEGPEELEAHITSLDFLNRLPPPEQITALRGLFSAYVSTADYVPPTGEAMAITTAEVGPRILAFFSGAPAAMQDRMGAQLWWSLMDGAPPKATWIAVLRGLKPVALKGDADPTLRPIYADLLAGEGIKGRDWR